MVMQITQLLIQADIINGQHAIWNTSSLLNERSLIGQLLYAVIGYEATPTPSQIYAYIITLTFMLYLIVRTLSNFKHREYV
jgi:high-affinity iron transporter